jgi:hypothetical protein
MNDATTNTGDNRNGLLTEYELYRAKNIQRNQRRLADLGLITQEEAQAVVDSAWKKNRVVEEQQMPTAGCGIGKRKGSQKDEGSRGVVQKTRSSSRVRRGTVKASTTAMSKCGNKCSLSESDDRESVWV